MKIAYFEGRPHGHPIHTKYAESIKADIFHFDHKFRYQDRKNSSKIRRVLSWFFSAVLLPNRKQYDVFFSQEGYFMIGLLKLMRLHKKGALFISLMDTHTPYFLVNNLYSSTTKKASKLLYNSYDAFICIGEVEYILMKELLGKNSKVKLLKSFNGVPDYRVDTLSRVTPNLESYNIAFVGSIPNKNRVFYKGIDIMFQAFCRLRKLFPKVTFTIIGEFDKVLIEFLVAEYLEGDMTGIHLVGQSENIEAHLSGKALYMHIARGEAWGISVNEAMLAGLPAIVSEWTGAKEAMQSIGSEFITSLEVNDVVDKVTRYFSLSNNEKVIYSNKCREVVANKYIESNAVANFKNVFTNYLRSQDYEK